MTDPRSQSWAGAMSAASRSIPSDSDFWPLLRRYHDVRNNIFPPGTFPPWYEDDQAFIRAFMRNHDADTGISDNDFYAHFVKSHAVEMNQKKDNHADSVSDKIESPTTPVKKRKAESLTTAKDGATAKMRLSQPLSHDGVGKFVYSKFSGC